MSTFVKEYDWMWLSSGLGLSPAECRVYAYIYGLTESKHSKTKGYNGSVRQLAKDLGLNPGGVSRTLRKLLDDNRIVLTDGVYRSVDLINVGVDSVNKSVDIVNVSVDSVNKSVDIVNVSVDSVNKSVDSVNSPLTTPLYKEINKEIEREEITREENFDASLSPQEDFFLVTLAAFGLQAGARNVTAKQERCAKVAWQRYTPEQQQALLDAVRKGYNVKGNFQFTVEDFLREQSQASPEPNAEPTNYNGCDPPDVPLAVACYKGEWGLYTLADIQKFNLKTKSKNEQ